MYLHWMHAVITGMCLWNVNLNWTYKMKAVWKLNSWHILFVTVCSISRFCWVM